MLPLTGDGRHKRGEATGATLKELMARLGHSSMRAAMIHQHATRDSDQAIAKALGMFVQEVRNSKEPTKKDGEKPLEEGA